jgi:hypothetical protein
LSAKTVIIVLVKANITASTVDTTGTIGKIYTLQHGWM